MRRLPAIALVFVAVAVALADAPCASAHQQPELRVDARRTPRGLVVTLDADDAARALLKSGSTLFSAADRALSISRSDGGPVRLKTRSAGEGRVIFEGPDPGGDLILSLSLFGRDDEGDGFVRVGDDNHARVLRVELPGVVRLPAIADPSSGVELASVDFPAFVYSGVEHILSGYDHLAFLLVLIVVSRRIGGVVKVATAFTLAHSVTLALAAFDVVRVPSAPIEAAIAASIVAAALWNVAAPESGHRALVAFAFGLVHGLGFSSGLAELLEGATVSRAGAVLGFNLGVELGQLAVLAIVAPVLLAWRRRAPTTYRRLGVRAISGAVASLGLFWLFERLG